jgi:hypothetical protein
MHRVCIQTHSSPRLGQRVKRDWSYYEAAISNTDFVAGTDEVPGAGESQTGTIFVVTGQMAVVHHALGLQPLNSEMVMTTQAKIIP